MEESLAPVVLFVYNRPHHTAKALEALAHNHLASQTHLIVYADGAKTPNDEPNVLATQKLFDNIKSFKSITLNKSLINKGLAKSIIHGVTTEIERFERVIVLEDDLITSPLFLTYMNNALEVYHQSDIFAISGYSPPIIIPSNYPYSTYRTMRICSWGWATWKNRWESIDWEVKDFDHFFRNPQQQSAFNKGGNDLTPMLLKYKKGEIASWAIRFAYHTFKNSGAAIYPTKSFVQNYGADGSGTNMVASSKYKTDLCNNLNINNFCPSNYINNSIEHNFKKFYNVSPVRAAINFFKRQLYLLQMN